MPIQCPLLLELRRIYNTKKRRQRSGYNCAIRFLYSEKKMTSPSSVHVTPERIMQFAWGYVPPPVLEAALRHRVFDVLDGSAKTIQEVQEDTGASARGLTAIMNALVGLQFLTKD